MTSKVMRIQKPSALRKEFKNSDIVHVSLRQIKMKKEESRSAFRFFKRRPLKQICWKRGKRRQKKKRKKKMVSLLTRIIFFLTLIVLSTSSSDRAFADLQWCIADEQTPDDVLQKALDWACGPGSADCRMIQPNKPCYLPNNMRNHASYAFNSYWQKFKNKGGSCYFNGAAMVTDLNPSHGPCSFEVIP